MQSIPGITIPLLLMISLISISSRMPAGISYTRACLFVRAGTDSQRAASSKLNMEGWNLVIHAPYSPDLAPNDFWAFPTLRRGSQVRRWKTMTGLWGEWMRRFRPSSICFRFRAGENPCPQSEKNKHAMRLRDVTHGSEHEVQIGDRLEIQSQIAWSIMCINIFKF